MATSKFFRAARAAQENTSPVTDRSLTLDPSTLFGQSDAVLKMASTFTDDRNQPVKVSVGDQSIGTIAKSNLPWFNIPDDAYHGSKQPSGFAKPINKDKQEMETIYEKDAGVFGKNVYASDDPLDVGRRLLVSGTESIRGSGAGLAQILAYDTSQTAEITNRRQMYGTEASPGYMPGGYKGSQADIVLTEDRAEDEDFEGVLENPTGLQTEEVLAMNRRERYQPKLTRSLSNPDLMATEEDYDRETQDVFRYLGLGDRLPKKTTEEF